MTERNLSATEKDLVKGIQRLEERILSLVERHSELQDVVIALQQNVSTITRIITTDGAMK